MSLLARNGYLVEHNSEATAAAYRRIAIPGPEECGCWYCRNWMEGRDRIIPDALKDLLGELRIPVNGEIEVWEVPGDNMPHYYGGWYMLAGRLLEKPSEEARGFSCDGWRLSFSAGASYQVDAFAGMDVCELHFVTEVGDFIEPSPADESR